MDVNDAIEFYSGPEVYERRHSPRAVTTPTVLVVDDDPAFRELLTEFMWDAGYRVREAGDGVEAFLGVDPRISDEGVSTEIDLVVVDLYMPRMSGLEFLAHIRRWSLTLPVITMSAFPDAKFYRTSYELGCAAAFAKPFSFFEFIDFTDSLFNR